ncbi:MAG TPA: TonB-dependent receptor [Longimicrobiales bacterium]|nr:TonB-dependent receptor [Longimicrobiales bacterium]
MTSALDWKYALRACAIALALTLPAGATISAQQAVVTIRVTSAEGVIAAARVSSGTISALTDALGLAQLRLAAGERLVRVEKDGYGAAEQTVDVRAGADTSLTVHLDPEVMEHEAIIVSSTRTGRRIEDEPVRVEVIGREEIEEKLLMTPGDIAMLLNETAGLRVQPTAPALGGASVRIQGLRGRYTQILSDGLPLYGGQTGALGALQIPPMDLGQVEVIKGVASALYGASALGGVVNLLSRRPADQAERELLLNQSTIGGTDVIGWGSHQVSERWGYTMLASVHRQTLSDIDDDGWADLPSYRRAVVRPRIFWNDGSGSSMLFTVGGMLEDREGGTVPGATTPAGTSFAEGIDTRRVDTGALGSFLLGGSRLLSIRGSAALQRHGHRFDALHEPDMHTTAFAEAAYSGTYRAHTWLVGVAVQHERFDSDSVPMFDYVHTTPAVFAQDEFAPADWLTIALSGRIDWHSEYGTFANPRLSALVRPADEWTVRVSAGTGFYAPTPWTEETEAVGLGRLAPSALAAERARSASLDIGRTLGPVELNATLFGSRIDDPVQARPAANDPSLIELFNAEGDVRTHGTELLARYHREGIHITATHVYMRSTEPDPGAPGRREVPLTPRHTAGMVAALEQEGRGRFGVELYYTGVQQLDGNPYRSESESHVIVGFLAERRFGPARLFLNAENILDTRQTRHDPLTLPARAPDGRWLTDVWAPLEGRSFNGGVRLEF